MGFGFYNTGLSKSGSDLARGMISQYSSSVEDMQAAVSSGGLTQNVSDDSDPKLFENLRSQSSILKTFTNMVDFVKTKYSEKSSRLTLLLDVAKDAQELASINNTNTPAPDGSFRSRINGMLMLVEGALNRTYNGLNLFSGTDTASNAVVDLVNLASPMTGALPNANYALDNGKDYIEMVRPETTISDTVRASDIGIQKLINGLKLLQTASTQPIDSARFSQAITNLRDSVQDLSTARTKINIIEETLGNVSEDMKKESIEVDHNLKNHGYQDMYSMIRSLIEQNSLLDMSRRIDMMLAKDLANTANIADRIV